MEITNLSEIVDVLDRCATVRIGLFGEEYPYVVPASFGYEVRDNEVVVYIHGAREGRKQELLARNNKVCVETDIFHRYAGTGHGVTTEYESVIGFGNAEAADRDEAVKGVALLLKHCQTQGYSAEDCIALNSTTVYKITLHTVTGKRNFVQTDCI